MVRWDYEYIRKLRYRAERAMLSAMRLVVFITVAWGVFFLLHLFVYVTLQRVFAIDFQYQYVVVGLLASFYFFASVLTRRFHTAVSRGLYFIAATWVGVLWLLFSATVAYELFCLVSGVDVPVVLSGLLICAVFFSIVALWNGRRLVVREYTLPIPGLTTPLRITHLTDIHVGTVHQSEFLRRVVTLTNNAKPDIVLMTGDLFDGSVPIDESILRPLNELAAPAYFTTGNHEVYEGLDHVRKTIGHLKMTLLENVVVRHAGVQIVGVHDRQGLPPGTTLDSVLESLPLSAGIPTILMYHTPVEWETARRYGVHLMVSGHTHNGQIFPFTLLVRLFFKRVKGLYEKDGSYLHISPGTGTWGPPMRLGSTNQVTVINVVPTT